MAAPLTPKQACDKIVAYIPKLSEPEWSRIASAIKAIRASRKTKAQMKFDIPDNGEAKDTTTD